MKGRIVVSDADLCRAIRQEYFTYPHSDNVSVFLASMNHDKNEFIFAYGNKPIEVVGNKEKEKSWIQSLINKFKGDA